MKISIPLFFPGDDAFEFDLVWGKAYSSRARGRLDDWLSCHLEFDEKELNWFLDNPSRIKGLKDWLENISKEKAKRYALEPSSELPRAEIEEKTREVEKNAAPLNDAEKKIALQMMTTAVIKKDGCEYKESNGCRETNYYHDGKFDSIISVVLKSLPKALRKVNFYCSSFNSIRFGVEWGSKYKISETSDELEKQYPVQFAVAKMFLEDKRWAECDSFEPEDVKILCEFMENKISYADIFKFYADVVVPAKKADEKLPVSDILNFYKCYNAEIQLATDLKDSDISKLYSFYVKVVKAEDENTKGGILKILGGILGVNKNSGRDIVLTSDFYKFFKNVVVKAENADKNVQPSDIFSFYKFYNSAKAKELELYKIVEFYESYTEVIQKDDYNNKSGNILRSYKNYLNANLNSELPAKQTQIFFDLAAITLISIVWAAVFYFCESFLGVNMFIGTTYICTTYILWFGLTVFFGTVFIVIIESTVWWSRFCTVQKLKFYNWRAEKALRPSLQECKKHYVRVIEPTEDIYEIKNGKLPKSIPYKGKKYDTAKIPQKGDSIMLVSGKDKKTLRKDGTPDNGLIYVCIKVYVKKKGIIKRLFNR